MVMLGEKSDAFGLLLGVADHFRTSHSMNYGEDRSSYHYIFIDF